MTKITEVYSRMVMDIFGMDKRNKTDIHANFGESPYTFFE